MNYPPETAATTLAPLTPFIFPATMTEKEIMAQIVAKVGPTEARQLVTSAYNSEIVANRLGRLEEHKTAMATARQRTPLLKLALERVLEVVLLMP